MKKFFIASVAAVAILTAQANAQTTIVFYSFNTNAFTGTGTIDTAAETNSVLTANIGSSLSSFSNTNTGGGLQTLTLLSSTGGNPNNHGFAGGNSVSQNGWNGNNSYFQFTLDSTGYQDIILAWAGCISGTGPTNTSVWYSSTGAGGTFTLFSTFPSVANTFATTQDLSSVAAIENNPNVVFRLIGSAVGAAGGTMKIDNFSIDATAVPEPSTVMLVVIGLAGLIGLRRRRS